MAFQQPTRTYRATPIYESIKTVHDMWFVLIYNVIASDGKFPSRTFLHMYVIKNYGSSVRRLCFAVGDDYQMAEQSFLSTA